MISPEACGRFSSDGVVIKKNRVFFRDFKGGGGQSLPVHFDAACLN